MGGGPLGVDEPAPQGLRGLVVCLNRIKTDLVEEGKTRAFCESFLLSWTAYESYSQRRLFVCLFVVEGIHA